MGSHPASKGSRHLVGLTPKLRPAALDTFLKLRPDSEEEAIILGLANVDADGPARAEAVKKITRFATLADIRAIIGSQRWFWKDWVASDVFNAVASDPGTGKTRFGMDLSRRIFHKLPFPDGQINPHPAGSKTLWIQGDRNFNEMVEVAESFGIPDDAVCLGSDVSDPFGSLNLDDPETLEEIKVRVLESGARSCSSTPWGWSRVGTYRGRRRRRRSSLRSWR